MTSLLHTAFAVLAAVLLLPVAAHAMGHDLYGDSAEYVVLRNGEAAGSHRLVFAGDETRLSVEARTRATMRIFGLFDVPFIYDSQAVWEEGALVTLSATFKQGGEGNKVWAAMDGEGGYHTHAGAMAAAPLLPSNHWNIAEVRQTVLFNTLSGNLVNVNVQPAGEEMLNIGGARVAAQRYEMDGDLTISLWYDARGKWLQLAFSVLGTEYQFRATRYE